MIREKLNQLRHLMQKHHFDAWIVPSADPHLSEYLPEYWNSRSWLSGFTGSAGTLIVTQNQAIVWTDSRYWEQATQQLHDSGVELGKMQSIQDMMNYLINQLDSDARVGVADDMISLAQKQQFSQSLSQKNIIFEPTEDLLNEMWTNRPSLPNGEIYPHHSEFVFESVQNKIQRIRQEMQTQGADFHLISSLDDIAWVTNLRGQDVSFNPVFISYLLIEKQKVTLFVHQNKLNPQAQSLLKEAQIQLLDYTEIQNGLAQLKEGILLLDPAKTAISTLKYLPKNIQIKHHINPSTLFKSQKSSQEQASIRQTMIYDGVALCYFFEDLENKFMNQEVIYEHDIDELLLKQRRKQPHFVSHSFDTIAGFNGNGAMPHYRAEKGQSSQITGQGLLLIDSGGQYQSGTTDITRVIPVGEATTQQKQDFTYVLKAHIALATTVFPEGISSVMLDAICRKPMWQAQYNYGHGTGHGVGYFLNVHEDPQRIAYMAVQNEHQKMQVGMLTSNEPGLYRSGEWGIRIENLIFNQKVENPTETAFGSFLYFETVTLCPIDARLIEKNLLTDEEISWVNNYHQNVRAKLLPYIQDKNVQEWLIKRTEAI